MNDEDLTARIMRQREEIDKLTRKSHEEMHEANERQRLALSNSHERILEYFWNSKRKEERGDLPLSVIYFFESEGSPSQFIMLDESKVNVLIAELVAKGYVERSTRKPDQYNFIVRAEEIIKLTPLGMKFLYKRHPPVFVWWTKLLDATPSSISLLITIVGLVASIFGIADFAINHHIFHSGN